MKRRGLLLAAMLALILCMACGVWLHVQQQRYACNRALIDAPIHNDTKNALALVNAGADPNTRCNPLPAPTLKLFINHLLHHAPLPANDSPTAFLVACGAAWYFQTSDGPVFTFIVPENLPLLQAMLVHGACLHTKMFGGGTALNNAISGERWHTMELLLQHGADVNEQDREGNTLLMYVARQGQVIGAHLLLSHGANPNVQNVDGDTALREAIQVPGRSRVIPDLTAHGANPNLPNKQGLTPLMIAQQIGRPDIVDLLKRGGGR